MIDEERESGNRCLILVGDKACHDSNKIVTYELVVQVIKDGEKIGLDKMSLDESFDWSLEYTINLVK